MVLKVGLAAVCAGLLAGCTNLTAALPPEPGSTGLATRMTPVDRPLSGLLDEGWIISSTGAPFLFTLSKGNKWVVCAVDDSNSKPMSQCWALN